MTDTPRDLLTAVDALRKPVTLARFTGVDHDHDWLDLMRPTTRDERDAARKAKQKLPKAVTTGEWWCPWCNVTVTERPDVEAQLHINHRTDPPLLDQLRERIGTALGDGGTRGANTGGSPIDVAAFSLHKRIDETLREWLGRLGARPGTSLTLAELLWSWYSLRLAGISPVGEDDIFRLTLEGWRTQILDILDPPTQIPYMGQACPICGETRAIRTVEGDAEDTVALWAFLRPAYREEGSYGMCKACNQILARDDDPLSLRRKMNGTITTGKVGIAYATQTGHADEGIAAS